MRFVASAGGAVALALAVVPMTPVQAASANPGHENNRIACTTSALTNAINGALSARGGTIELARDCRYVLTSALPNITQPITLHGGKGTSIERSSAPGTPLFRIFEVAATAGFLTLDDLTVRNGHVNGDGGAVLVGDGRTLLLRSVTLTRNRAEGNGGAVANVGGRVILHDSKVEKNAADNVVGGGGDGGGIHTTGGVVSIDSSAVSGNRAADDGGGVASESGYVTTTHSTVGKNEAEGDGGGIDNNGTAHIRFTSVTGNRASGNGGGIRNAGTLVVGRSSINMNTAASGGGIHNTDNAWIGRSVIKGNTATTGGGGLWNDGEATVESSDVTGNETNGVAAPGGGVLNSAGNTVLTDSTVTKNQASDGGGIYETAGDVTLNRTRVKDNDPNNCSPTITGCVG
ncbi:hypothetical protein QMZ92_16610 [Streptomyces sp. HNM0645]|uniref:hypothetical protein n=1 Tax=Streptomyces sp. HNM0645 TaxID=2782343 RepID=UPI0024B70BD5|nr:hypothetical protein [Streptomyces sp. HNM0645]MDI9885957.1 hypothetical protein [Streptomyces sp. HNM0645]